MELDLSRQTGGNVQSSPLQRSNYSANRIKLTHFWPCQKKVETLERCLHSQGIERRISADLGQRAGAQQSTARQMLHRRVMSSLHQRLLVHDWVLLPSRTRNGRITNEVIFCVVQNPKSCNNGLENNLLLISALCNGIIEEIQNLLYATRKWAYRCRYRTKKQNIFRIAKSFHSI